jgi:hypothetical protein
VAASLATVPVTVRSGCAISSRSPVFRARPSVERVDDGWLYRRDPIEPKLREFNRETLRRTMAMNTELRRLLTAGYAQHLRDRGL